MTISRDEGVLGGEPRIDGTRIGVRHVAAYILEAGCTPAVVADQYDISLAEVYEAMAYYYENIEEMREVERAHQEAASRLRDVSLAPKDPIL